MNDELLLSPAVEEALQALQLEALSLASSTISSDSIIVTSSECTTSSVDATVTIVETSLEPYEFDRKFLFRVLVLGNAQLAQIIKARGPNMQTNAACAGT